MRLSSLSKYVKCCLLCFGYERTGPKGASIMQMEQIPFLLSSAAPPPPPSWQLTVLSLCVSFSADNSFSDLSQGTLESGSSCLRYAERRVCSTAKMKDHESLTHSPPPPPFHFPTRSTFRSIHRLLGQFFVLTDSIWHRQI